MAYEKYNAVKICTNLIAYMLVCYDLPAIWVNELTWLGFTCPK